jgi:predicted RNA-binding protein with PIN domain
VDHYSISSLGTFNRCPRQWEYVYIKKQRKPPAGAMIVGSAVHKPQEVHCKRIIGGGEGLGLAEYQETAAGDFAKRKTEVDWTHEEDDADKCLDRTVRLASAHHRIVVPSIVAPIAAEEQIDVRFDGADWTLRCILDVVQRADSGVLIRDLKTKGRQPNGAKAGNVEVDPAHRTQLEAYRMAWREAHNEPALTCVDYVWSPAKGDGQAITAAVDPDNRELALLLEDLTAMDAQVRAGLFPRRRDGWWCGERSCGFWATCIGNAGKDL